jgi:ABC-type uncharacterized transport system permease subunit
MTRVLEQTAFHLGYLAYVVAAVAFFVQVTRRAAVGPSWLAPAILGVGSLAHFVYLLLASVVARVCPVESLHFALSVVALVVSGAYLLGRLRWPIDALGLFVAPLGLTFLLGTRVVGLGGIGTRLPPLFLTLHVGANLVGLSLFLLACVSAGLYLFVEKRLKQKRFSSVAGKLPPLDALDRAEHRFLLTGFPLLTLGIVSGTAWAYQLEFGGVGEVLRAVFSYVTWLVFAAVLLLRAAAGWRGRRAAWGTITGFFFASLVLIVYLVRPAHAVESPRPAHAVELHSASGRTPPQPPPALASLPGTEGKQP